MIRLIIVAITVIGFLILSIPISVYRMDHRQIFTAHERNQFFTPHTGSIQTDFVGSRHEGDDHR